MDWLISTELSVELIYTAVLVRSGAECRLNQSHDELASESVFKPIYDETV